MIRLSYTYSIDGGQTYSERKAWPGSDVLTGKYEDTFTLSLAVPSGTKPSVIVRAYNMFDPNTESNRYDSPEIFIYNEEPETEGPKTEGSAESGDAVPAVEDENRTGAGNPGDETGASSSGTPESVAVSGSAVAAEKPVSFVTFLEICLVIVILLFIILLVSQGIAYHNRKKRRLQSRKDAGESRNQHR
ncbi:MAG: hypothetical protein K2J60_12365 [Acetatifactor sp.]|nr:hypothetical protein [Acetatifactor sp.]